MFIINCITVIPTVFSSDIYKLETITKYVVNAVNSICEVCTLSLVWL